jgi:predicted transcriptional regulator of viral defense system
MDAIIEKKILELAQDSAGVSPRDLEKLGIPRQYLYKLYNKGLLERVARGLYSIADSEPSEYRTIAEVCKRIPEGVICLLSALQLHGLTAQMPHQIWLAIEPTKRRPKEPNLPIRLVHFSGEAFSSGIEERHIEGVMVKVYNPAKTVGDCFKFRNRLGLDVALEALRDCRRQRKCTNDNLYLYAKICRVWNVMKPYMEAIV